jgi:pantoate--beta-alanine ligase
MKVISSPEEVLQTSLRWKQKETVGLVTTMGALHEAHLSLVRLAKHKASKCIVSIFVNPLQFAPSEDFDKYPRPFDEDREKLEAEGVDVLFAPVAAEYYPAGFNTKVSVSGLSEHLCGRSRPHFFSGVATVCTKLFLTAGADLAVFGEKDYQQLRVLEQLVTDLNIPMKIVSHPTVREADGLAMSSRNAYLSMEERAWASLIPESLRLARQLSTSDEIRVGDLLKQVRETLAKAPLRVEYAEITSEVDLVPQATDAVLSQVKRPRIFLAVRSGATRLIDNQSLSKEAI